MKRLIMQTGFVTLMTLLLLSATAIAEEWTNVVVNHEEQFTDGGGMKRKAKVTSIKFKPHTVEGDKMGNFEIQDLMFNVEIDGSTRTVIYSVSSIDQINVMVLGSSPQETISFVFHSISRSLVNNENITGALKGAGWIMSYNGVRLFGIVGEGAQRSTVGTDPISFAALSYNPFSSPKVVKPLKDTDGSQATQSALKIFGGLFGGPKVGGSLKCSKKKIKTLECTAQCTQTAEGCPCECMGMPCCSQCKQTEETVWEYSAGAQVG